MRLDFFRRGRWVRVHTRGDIGDLMARAAARAGSMGIDSLDLLIVALDTPQAARLIAGIGRNPKAIQTAAEAVRVSREIRPGLTDDAKVVIKAAADRAIKARADWDVDDLLAALAEADCRARRVLAGNGVTAAGLAAWREGKGTRPAT